MTFRPGPLRAAAVLAAGFVAVRVVYRVLFHGADGSGALLLDLPSVRLPPPFAHVVLFGPVTTGGLWDAAVGALPIALTILAFGLLNALVDLPRVLARGARRGPLHGVARTLAIAWATLPALADAVRAVRFAQRLRGEKGGVRLLTPVLTRTLARATALAAALELRGLAGRPVDGDCERPVEVRGATLQHGGSGAAVRVPDLALAPASLTVVAGSTGSGKSTLLRALAGLHTHVDGGTVAGTLRIVGHERAAVPPRDTARRIGVVLQHPREGFATDRVRDELGLALELRGVAQSIIGVRVADVAERIGIAGLLDRQLRGLSAGEATLVAIGAAIIEHPIVLLVDEPLADLDSEFRGRIVALLAALAHEAGVCVVVAEHRVAEFADVADRQIWIGESIPDADLVPRSGVVSRGAASPAGEGLRTRELDVRHGKTIVITGANLQVAPGEVAALVGPNGAGKSSLLAAIALPDAAADVTIDGRPARASRSRRDRPADIALVPDLSDDLFVCDTVAAECARADRHARLERGTTLARWAGFLGRAAHGADVARSAARHPLDLSLGERRCLAVAIQLAPAPRVLLVDEPTRGLDAAARGLVAAAVADVAATGTAVLIATHDREFADAVASFVLPIRAGRVGAAKILVASPVTLAAEDPARFVSLHSLDDRVAPDEREAVDGRGATVVATQARTRRLSWSGVVLIAANLVALAAFAWPFVATAVPSQAQAAVPAAALALAPLAALVVLSALDGTVRSAHTLALLGTLAAIGAAIRIVGTGVGGVEAVFILLILAGRALGARFGLLLGLFTILLSSVVTGGIGPWTPFQMFACAWVGAGAGLLPRRVSGVAEAAMLCVYGVIASYAFGLIMNLWFWPFAVGSGTAISYEAGAPVGQNLASFLLYSLITSSLTWDTLRAIVTVVGIVVVGRAILAALRRAKPLTPPG